tara:strand:+ start:652 stop:870 length:219 start_codon:yes stop_codon:yes gene_type:complete
MFTNELFPDEENSTQGDGDGGGGYQYGGDTSATPAPPPPGGGTVGEPVDPSGPPPRQEAVEVRGILAIAIKS